MALPPPWESFDGAGVTQGIPGDIQGHRSSPFLGAGAAALVTYLPKKPQIPKKPLWFPFYPFLPRFQPRFPGSVPTLKSSHLSWFVVISAQRLRGS